MSSFPLPPDENERLRALHAYGVLDTPAEAAFERITALASRLLGMPIALVSLVDAERQWFKSICGFKAQELPRAVSFCTHAILSDDVLVIPDATRDPRFAGNPLVTGPLGVRFYAGAPLQTPDRNHRLGTLCVIDHQPRTLDAAGQQTLRDLAAIVVDELELRRETRRRQQVEAELAHEQSRCYRQLVEQASDAFFIYDFDGRLVDVNQAAGDTTGYTRAELLSMNVADVQVDLDQAAARASWESLVPGRPVTTTGRHRRKDGRTFPAESRISVLHPAGAAPTGGEGSRRVFALVRDVTEQQRVMEVLREANDQLEQRVTERTAAVGQANAGLQAALEENGRLDAIINSASLGVIIVDAHDPDHPIIFANPAFMLMTGYARDEILGRNCRFLQGPGTEQAAVDRLSNAIRAGQPFRGTLLNYRRDQTSFWNELTISPVVAPGADHPRYFVGVQVDVTARRQAEERLRLLESAVLNVNDAIIITEAEPTEEPGPRIFFANAAFERMTGHSEKEVLGRNPRLMQGPNTAPEARANIRKALNAWRPVRQELVNYRKDGSEFWVELNIVPVANERGWFTHWVSVQRDITEWKNAEHALRDSEGRYRRLFDTNPLPAWVYDRETLRFLEVNPAAISHYGYTRAEFLERTIRDIRPPEEVPGLEAFLGNRAGGPTAPGGSLNWRHRRKDGREILVQTDSDDLSFAGRAARLVVVHDVTEQRRMERALRESQGRLERITANVPGMVYQFARRADGSMDFPFVSEGCEEISGLEPEAMRQDPTVFLNLMERADRVKFINSLAASAASLRPWRWEGVIRSARDGRPKHLQATSRPERLENGDTVWDGVVVDVTERKQTEELQRAKAEAERANAAKSEFLSRMSHELRTPLNAILGFGQLLELEPLSPPQAQSVAHIMHGGRHLLGLINEVLDITRIESGHLDWCAGPVELRPLLRETLGLVRPLANAHGIRLRGFAADEDEAAPSGDAGSVWANPGRLKQILFNLLSNAVKYNRPDGEVRLRWVELPPATPHGTPRVRLTVQDTGEGIAPDLLARLFVPFERLGAAHGQVKGTGLGLTVSKRLVEAMGGSIGVDSIPGIGSSFWVEILRTGATSPGYV